MPSRNAAAHIGEALHSVSAQRNGLSDIKVILADGGSTDETVEIAETFDFLERLTGQDNGIYDGFNRGIAACDDLPDHAILGILNADDMLPPAALSNAISALNGHPDAQMVSGSARFHDGTDLDTILVQSNPMSVQSLLFAVPAINARFFRLGLVRKVGGFEPRAGIAADREWLMRVLRSGLPRMVIDEQLYIFRAHEGSTTMAANAAGRERVWKAEEDLAVYLKDDPEATAAERRFADAARQLSQMKRLVATKRRERSQEFSFGSTLRGVAMWRRWRGRLSGW